MLIGKLLWYSYYANKYIRSTEKDLVHPIHVCNSPSDYPTCRSGRQTKIQSGILSKSNINYLQSTQD